jgi:integrase
VDSVESQQCGEARSRQRREGGRSQWTRGAEVGFHDLRHTFASHLIRAGVDPVRASRQLGHARPIITLDIYAHEFDQARGLDDVRNSIDAAFGPNGI